VSVPASVPVPPVDEPAWVTRRRAVEARLMVAAGDRSLCDLSRAGAPGGVKDLEGRMAALAEVDRAVRAGRTPADAVGAVTAAWRHELAADEARGPVWLAYRRGGVEELDALAADLAG
jgi:hypothetical protein